MVIMLSSVFRLRDRSIVGNAARCTTDSATIRFGNNPILLQS